MKTIFTPLRRTAVLLMLGLMATISHAQIYKWVDENGRTHYSERPADAGKSSAQTVKVNGPSGKTQSSEEAAAHWQEQDRQLKQRQMGEQYGQRKIEITVRTQPQSLSGGRAGNTDQSKCNLARDVLSGAVRHSNGAETDEKDRRVARRDVEKYCH